MKLSEDHGLPQKRILLNQALKQLVLEVHIDANKPRVAEALKKLFNVETKDIRISVVKGKYRRAGRGYALAKRRKKAIVTLKEGYNVDLAGWAPSAESDSGNVKV